MDHLYITPGQRRVLDHMANGGLFKTADWVSVRTAEHHVARAKKKNGCKTLAELMYRMGREDGSNK